MMSFTGFRGFSHAYRAQAGRRADRRARRQVSRGQALVEFALFIPLLLLMVIGATDISTLLDNHLTVVYAARAGARVGSIIGDYAPNGAQYTADCAVIGAVQAALSSTRTIQVTNIAIYEADSTGGYSAARPQDDYAGNTICSASGAPTPAATRATWAPGGGTRSNTPFFEESLGVAITYTYTYSFNLFNLGPTSTVTDYAVMPIEIVVNPFLPTPTPTPSA